MFDVVIPTYNNLEELKHCLKAFEKQSFKDFNVFVCVDGSTDGTLEYLNSSDLNLKLNVLEHPDKKNNGRNLTRNLCIPYLSNKYLLMIDSDCVPKPDLLMNHKMLLDKDEIISVGEVYYTNTRKNLWARYLQTRGKGRFKNNDTIPPHYLNTQNVALYTKIFLDSGGQDLEMSKSYGGDDTELGYRLNKEYSQQVVFNKSAAVFSEMDKTLSKALSQMKEFGNRNLKILRKKHPEFKTVFRADLFEGKSLKHQIVKLMLHPVIASIIKSLLPLVPGKLKLSAIHYLVMASIFKGYKKPQQLD